mgnify:FL=1
MRSDDRMTGSRAAVIISLSSDIGVAMSRRWRGLGWQVYGTYRTKTTAVEQLERQGTRVVSCNLSDVASIRQACADLTAQCPSWDVLVLCPGTQEPVGSFQDCDFDAWEASIHINFTGQLRVVHALLPTARQGGHPEPLVLFFAGGGTNNATVSYSAYTVSKIALMKMGELLDAEIPNARFAIVGPGWVNTKIHEATLRAGRAAGANYRRTLETLAGTDCTPVERVLDCCDWILQAKREVVSGRNFAVAFDPWNTEELERLLLADPHMYKLRRFGNDRARPITRHTPSHQSAHA